MRSVILVLVISISSFSLNSCEDMHEKINTKYHFGLSATPNRADGMTKVTNLYIGPIIYKVDTSKSKREIPNIL